MRTVVYAMLGVAALAVAPGCKQNSAEAKPRVDPPATATPAAVPVKPAAATTPAAPAAPVTELTIASIGNQMKFDKEKLTVKTGARVHLVFHSNSTIEVMPHNWTLVKPGTEAAVALAGLNKGEAAGYIDPGPDVLAYTPLATKALSTVETTFTAPAPGTYPYICTVPGHYVVMHGELVVTP